MLIQPDRNELGDRRLDLKESAIKAHEDNKKLASQYRIPDQDLLEDQKQAIGSEMDWQLFVTKLLKLSTNIVVEKGGVTGAVAVRFITKDKLGKPEKRYVSGFYIDCKLPEFSSVIVDENGLPKREIRGWRSVLEALVRAGALTQKQCDLTFGPALGQRAILWDRSRHFERR
jgi:hypothetical protein